MILYVKVLTIIKLIWDQNGGSQFTTCQFAIFASQF